MGTSRHGFLDSRTEYCVAAESKKVQTVSRSEETREKERERQREGDRESETRNAQCPRKQRRIKVFRVPDGRRISMQGFRLPVTRRYYSPGITLIYARYSSSSPLLTKSDVLQ